MVDVWGGAGRVLVLDPATMRTNVVGPPGDGPGEVRIPLHMTVTPDGGVAVLDGGRHAIEIYGATGQPVQRVQLQEPIVGHKGFTALAVGGFVITGYLPSSGAAVHYFNANGEHVLGWRQHPAVPGAPAPGSPWRNNLERDAAMAQLAVTGGWVHGLPDGSFLYSQAAPHEIVLFERSPTSEGQSLFQVFDQQDEGDGARAVLVADVLVDRLYKTWFLSENGDILAHVNDPVTGADYAVRLRLSGFPGRGLAH